MLRRRRGARHEAIELVHRGKGVQTRNGERDEVRSKGREEQVRSNEHENREEQVPG